MTRDEITTFFDRRQRAWQARDASSLTACHTEGGIVESPMFGAIHSRVAIEKSYRDLFTMFDDWQFEGKELIVEGNRVVQPFQIRATQTKEFFGVPATGRRFEIHGVMIFTLERGLIAHERRIYDFTALLIQIGVLKARPK